MSLNATPEFILDFLLFWVLAHLQLRFYFDLKLRTNRKTLTLHLKATPFNLHMIFNLFYKLSGQLSSIIT